MSLEIAIVSLWIIASMLACWCFSLIVRLIAEWIARKRRRLAGRYTRKSLVLAFVLIGVCAMAAIFSAGSAYLLGSTAGVRLTVTPIGAIGGGVLLFACFLMIWASVGDRSRGRLRCPRCWYDMRDSRGMLCPECGREISDDRQLLRTRRPRWAFVVAALFVVVGLGGVLMNQRYSNQGLVGFIPDSLLLPLWKSAPASWMYDTGGNYSEGTLRDRIVSGQIDAETRRGLVNEILDEMAQSRTMRWDPRALNLLDGALYRELYGEGLDNGEPIWLPSERRLERAYGATLGDLATMLANGPRDAVDDSMLGMHWYDTDMIRIGRRWLLSHEIGRPEEYYSFDLSPSELRPNYAKRIPAYLDGLIPSFKGIDELDIFGGDGDFEMRGRLLQLLADTGSLPSRVEPYLDAVESSVGLLADAFYEALGTGLASLPPDRRAGIYARMEGWLRSDDLPLRVGGIKIMEQCGLVLNASSSPRTPEFGGLIETAIRQCVDDERMIPGLRSNATVSARMGQAVVRIDETGIYAFPCVRYALRTHQDDSARAWYNRRSFSWEDGCIAKWVEIFGPMSKDDDAEIREWVAQYTPERTGSPSDAILEDMLRRLAEDEDASVSDSAMVSLEARRAYERGEKP